MRREKAAIGVGSANKLSTVMIVQKFRDDRLPLDIARINCHQAPSGPYNPPRQPKHRTGVNIIQMMQHAKRYRQIKWGELVQFDGSEIGVQKGPALSELRARRINIIPLISIPT